MDDPDSDQPGTPAGDLSFEEARVLGCLLEKEITTPEYYPMTLNAVLAAACQKSNRSPVVEWDDRTVEHALDGLRRKRLAVMISMAGSRGPKYKHTIDNVYGSLDSAMIALLCELLVRNVQTPGELRTHAARLHAFPSLEFVEEVAGRLLRYGVGPLITVLPAGAGRRVKAFAHLLCGPVADAGDAQPAAAPSGSVVPPPPDWQAKMEGEVAALRAEVAQLRQLLEELTGGPASV